MMEHRNLISFTLLWWNIHSTFFTNISIATCRYNFTDVPWKEVGQSIVLRDSLSLGQFALLKSSVPIQVNGGGG